MKRTIARKYELTKADVVAAMMAWMASMDVPRPVDETKALWEFDAHGNLIVEWTETSGHGG